MPNPNPMCDSNVNANPYMAGPFRFLGLTASDVDSSTKSRPAMYNVVCVHTAGS